MSQNAETPAGETHKAVQACVLIVDDEDNVRKSLKRLLSRHQYQAVTAENFDQAIAQLADHSIDLLITDLRMPGKDGIELLRYAYQHHPNVARILLTGHADVEHTVRAINEGATGVILTKPWDDAILLRAVEEQLERALLRRGNEQLLRVNMEQNKKLMALNQSLEKRVSERTRALQTSHQTLQKSNTTLLQSYRSTIRLLLEVASVNPGIDSTFAKTMAEVSVTLSKALDLPASDVTAVRYACQLHEIGKLALPAELNQVRESLLTSSAWQEYSAYPERGAQLLTSVDYLSKVSLYINHHREHWDGTGFPHKLKEAEIPLGSQLVLLCRDYTQALEKYRDKKAKLGKRVGSMNIQVEALQDIEPLVNIRYPESLYLTLKEALAIEEVEVDEGVDGADKKGHLVSARTLEPGMELAQDVYTNQDILMLTQGQKLTARHIEKLLALESEFGRDLSIYIRH
ncbi:HD domain-containing phosphohydrolase [Saccharospirillum impatiens]|uniref:HD domain-containing phosphohydrolase n=1 Tax=Saccharospirillum impatiens TaxID=169438 RepID=UPI00040D4F7C|nr:HD domain-containing phosphohydrolase [Saccharospirillum impatiens]